MTHFEELYKKYASGKQAIDAPTVDNIVAQYGSLLNLSLTTECLVLNNYEAPLNCIPLKNIIDIIDEPQHIYIILRASIYILCKESGETRIHIRNL